MASIQTRLAEKPNSLKNNNRLYLIIIKNFTVNRGNLTISRYYD